jgi:hypothetical protein
MNYYIMIDKISSNQTLVITSKMLERNYDYRLPDQHETVKYVFKHMSWQRPGIEVLVFK